MQQSLADQVLTDNEWISSAVACEAPGDARDGMIEITVSRKGHELICTKGMREFELRLLERLPDAASHKSHWQFAPVEGGYFSQHEHIRRYDLPPVLSWIKEDSRHRLLLNVLPHMDCFRGHYPGNPILPGVIQVHWAVGVSMGLFGFASLPADIKRLKFKNIVQPPRVIELDLRRSAANLVNFQFSSAGRIHSMGSLAFKEDELCVSA